jgi:hypothetical protein
MRSFLANLANILSASCAILFAVTLFLALLLFNSEAKLFDAATYKTALKSQDVYARMPGILAKQITSTPAGQSDKPSYVEYLTLQDWELLIKTLIPPEQIQIISEQTIDSLIEFLNYENENPVISIVDLKKTLTTNSSEAVTRFFTTRPACTNEQLAAIFTSIMAGQQVNPGILCSPPPEVMSLALPLVSGIFAAEIAVLPDTIPLFQQKPLVMRDEINRIRWLARLSPLLPLALLALVTLFGVRSLTGWLKWWGYPLYFGGAFTLIFALLSAPAAHLAISYAAAQGNSLFIFQLLNSELDVVPIIIRQIAFPLGIESFFIMLAGLGMAGTVRLITKGKLL